MRHPVSCETIERLQASVPMPPSQWEHLLDRATLIEGFPVAYLEESKICELADALDLSPDRVIDGNIDYTALSRHWSGDLGFLPERYRTGARSRLRTSMHLLDSLELHHGWRSRLKVMRQLQVTEASVGNPDQLVSICFLTDVCRELLANGVSKEALFYFGGASAIANINSPLGKRLALSDGPKELFLEFFEELISRYFDRNFRYHISSIGNSVCVVDACPDPDLLDDLKVSRIGSESTCAARRGTAATFPLYLGLSPAQVVESRCIHRGDDHCRYEINFLEAMMQWSSRGIGRSSSHIRDNSRDVSV